LLVGDLNARPEDPELSRLLEVGFRDADLTGLPTAPAGNPSKRIDYVLATPDFRLRGIRRPFTEASDHLPVWVQLTPA
jgi:endonuclease/exonuclease/phosphatase family metal-dependent hydrolase